MYNITKIITQYIELSLRFVLPLLFVGGIKVLRRRCGAAEEQKVRVTVASFENVINGNTLILKKKRWRGIHRAIG